MVFCQVFESDFVADRFLQPTPNCSFRVRLHVFYAIFLKLFLLITTSAASEAAKSFKVASHVLQLDQHIYKKKLNCINLHSQHFLKAHLVPIPFDVVDWYLCLMESLIDLKKKLYNVFSELNVGGFCKRQNKSNDTDRY